MRSIARSSLANVLKTTIEMMRAPRLDRKWMDRHVRDGDKYRQVQFKDIVILHRSPKTQAFDILDTLKKFGVPAYVPDEENYFQANEVQVIMR